MHVRYLLVYEVLYTIHYVVYVSTSRLIYNYLIPNIDRSIDLIYLIEYRTSYLVRVQSTEYSYRVQYEYEYVPVPGILVGAKYSYEYTKKPRRVPSLPSAECRGPRTCTRYLVG